MKRVILAALIFASGSPVFAGFNFNYTVTAPNIYDGSHDYVQYSAPRPLTDGQVRQRQRWIAENEQKALERAAYEQQRREQLREHYRESGRMQPAGRRFRHTIPLTQ